MNPITISTEIPLWGLITLGVSLLTSVWVFFATRRKDIEARFVQGSRRMDDLTRRIDAVEGQLHEMPGREDVHKLELMLASMGGDLKAMNATLLAMAESQKRTESIVGRHEDFMRGSAP